MIVTRNENLEHELIREIDESMNDGDRHQPSVSGMIYCLTKTFYENEMVIPDSNGKQFVKHSEDQIMMFICGLGLEATLLKGRQQSEYGELDGIQWHLDHYSDTDGRFMEVKSTRISSKKSSEFSEGWVKQIKSYFKAKGILEGDLTILHLMGSYCLAPDTLVLTSNLSWVPLNTIKVGDKLLGIDEYGNYNFRRAMRESVVESIAPITRPTYKITMSDGTILTSSQEHLWLGMKYKSSNGMDWIKTSDLKVGMRIRKFGNTWKDEDSLDIGWLAGIIDGEGSIDNRQHGLRVSIAQNDGPVLDKVLNILEAMNIDVTIRPNPDNDCFSVRTESLYESMRLLGITKPIRMNKPSTWEGLGLGKTNSFNEIANIEFLGEQELIAIGTSTKTLMANGYVSHNSPPFPQLLCWHLEFSQQEIDDNWQWIKDRAVTYKQAVDSGEPPTPFKHMMDWECKNCSWKGLCDARSILSKNEVTREL